MDVSKATHYTQASSWWKLAEVVGMEHNLQGGRREGEGTGERPGYGGLPEPMTPR